MSDIAEIEAHLVRAQAAYDKLPLSGPVTSWCELYGEDLLDSCTKLFAALKQRTELIDAAAGHWLESCRTTSPPIAWEGAIDGAMEAVCKEVERLRARVAELEKERDGALADACSARIYASDATVHLRVRVAELEAMVAEAAEIRRKWGIESDESLTECVERNIEGWKQRALKAEQRVAELEAAQEWRPIESAPRDTKVVVMLALKNGHVATARRWSANIDRWTSLDGECDYTSASHWLPLPAPPKVAT